MPVTVIRSKTTCAPFKPSGADGFDVAVLLRDARAQMLQPREMKIDRPRADRAAARQRNARPSRPRHQRPQHEARRPHGLHQFVGRFRRNDLLRVEHNALGSLSSTAISEPISTSSRSIVRISRTRGMRSQHYRLVGQQRRGQRRQRGILRPAGRRSCRGAARRPRSQIYPLLAFSLPSFPAVYGCAHVIVRFRQHTSRLFVGDAGQPRR